MLRVILWKLGFEWANIVRILHPRSAHKIYYFAFGANLSPDILRQRGIKVYETNAYILERAALRFSQPGFYKSHGYASADYAQNESVYGNMLLIGLTDAKRMDYYEGVPFLGVHEKVFGQYQNEPFYYYRAFVPEENLKPTQEYLDYLTTAYRKIGCVPESYIESMEATEVLKTLEPLTKTGQFVRNLNSWPTITQPFLVLYERLCRQLVQLLWNRSLLNWVIKA